MYRSGLHAGYLRDSCYKGKWKINEMYIVYSAVRPTAGSREKRLTGMWENTVIGRDKVQNVVMKNWDVCITLKVKGSGEACGGFTSDIQIQPQNTRPGWHTRSHVSRRSKTCTCVHGQ